MSAPHTHLLAAHFTQPLNLHGGDFANNASAYSRASSWASALRARQPRIGAVRLTIVHDDAEVQSLSAQDAEYVSLIRVVPESITRVRTMAANDLRWLAWESVLVSDDPRGASFRTDAAACIMGIDVGDVGVINNFNTLCAQYPDAVLAASDSCGVSGSRGVRSWLRRVATLANFSLATAPWLHDFLTLRSRVPVVFNCGIVGGRRPTFTLIVRDMAAAIRRHYNMHPGAYRLVDMLVFNELVLRRLATERETLTPALVSTATRHSEMRKSQDIPLRWNTSVVTGWPLGPLNLPMFGSFCGRDPCSNPLPAALNASSTGIATSSKAKKHVHEASSGAVCLRHLMLKLAPAYFFVHKVPYLQFPLPVRAWTKGF